MRINKTIIKKLNPCDSRFNNYLKHYSDFDGSLEDFILLDKITYSDKVWVFTRLATKMQNVKWSLLCASKVLSSFESVYPNDDRPRKALEAVEAYLNNPSEENKSAAWSAASAAMSAGSVAWSAWSARSAMSAESAASAAMSAAMSAESAASAAMSAAWSAEEEVNLLFMIEALKK